MDNDFCQNLLEKNISSNLFTKDNQINLNKANITLKGTDINHPKNLKSFFENLHTEKLKANNNQDSSSFAIQKSLVVKEKNYDFYSN